MEETVPRRSVIRPISQLIMTNVAAAETLERQATKDPKGLLRRHAEIEAATYMLLKVADVLGFYDDLGERFPST